MVEIIAPENKLSAARLAWKMGAHRWGTDVNLTRDRQLVLFHDLTLSRCTDAPARFVKAGADGIITDFPQVFVS